MSRRNEDYVGRRVMKVRWPEKRKRRGSVEEMVDEHGERWHKGTKAEDGRCKESEEVKRTDQNVTNNT